VIERKENYWAANSDIPALQAKPKRIVFHIIPDELSIINQLKEGKIDLYAGAASKSFLDMKEDKELSSKLSFMTAEVLRTYYVLLNNSLPELSSPETRRAMAHLMDVDEIMQVMEGGLAKRARSVINSTKKQFNDDLPLIQKDIAKAKNLLANANWKDTNNDGTIDKKVAGKRVEFDLDMYTTGSDLSTRIALLLQENAKQVGIKINIIQKKYSLTKRENIAKLDYGMMTGAVTQAPISDDPYAKWHTANAEMGGTNAIAYKSAEASRLIDLIRDTPKEDKRLSYYHEFQQIMHDDQPVIWLYHPLEKVILSKKWKGTTTVKRPGYLANTFEPTS